MYDFAQYFSLFPDFGKRRHLTVFNDVEWIEGEKKEWYKLHRWAGMALSVRTIYLELRYRSCDYIFPTIIDYVSYIILSLLAIDWIA